MKISKSINLQVLIILSAVSDGLKFMFQKLKRSTLTWGHSFKQVWEERNKHCLIDDQKSF